MKRASHLYLWTERGANHHCKILDTDKAWEQFENLEETYFRVKEAVNAFVSPDTVKYLNGVANYLRIQRAIMKDKGCTPLEIAQMDKLNETLGILDYKCWYYETAQKAGTCKIHDTLSADDIPQELKKAVSKLKGHQ